MRVVVVGGGYAGVAVAKKLDADHEVVLVEQREMFFHNVAALRAAVDPAWADRLTIPYDRLLSRGRVVHDRAREIRDGTVALADGPAVEADAVVVATGSAYPFPAKPAGADVAAARERLKHTAEQVAAAGSVLVLGAGPVGLELAGEVAAARPDKPVTVVDPAPEIVTGPYRPALRRRLRRQLDALGVRLLLADAVDPAGLGEAGRAEPGRVVRTAAGVEVPAEAWFQAYGSRPVTDALAGALTDSLGPGGRLRVDQHLRVVGHDRVFAVGDVTDVAEPKTAAVTRAHATVVAAAIAALADGRAPTAAHRPATTPVLVVPLGPRHGAAHLPLARGVVLGPRAARTVKGRDLLLGHYQKVLNHRR